MTSIRTAVAVLLCGAVAALGGTSMIATSIFGQYADNRTHSTPNYITEDLLLVSYAMIADDAVAATEEKQAYPEIVNLVAKLRARVDKARTAIWPRRFSPPSRPF